MSNFYTREDVENLLVQLKRYRKVIRHYQENDKSLDYYRVKSELKELKTRLAGTKEKLLQIEEKYKDCLFDYHKIVEEKEDLKHEINRLKEVTRINKNSKAEKDELQNTEDLNLSQEELRSLMDLLRASLVYQIMSKLSEFKDTKDSTLKNSSELALDTSNNELIKDMQQFLVLAENWLFMLSNREESGTNMVSDKGNDIGRILNSDVATTGTNQIEQAIIKGAEPDDFSKQTSNFEGDSSIKETGNQGMSTNQLDVTQVNSTLSNLQGQIIEIKKILQEKNAVEMKQPIQTQLNPFQHGTGFLKNAEQDREITFRDLKGLSNLSQVISKAPPEKIPPNHKTKNNLTSSKKQGSKPVYVRDRKVGKKQVEIDSDLIQKESNTRIIEIRDVEHEKNDVPAVKLEHEKKSAPILEHEKSYVLPKEYDEQREINSLTEILVQNALPDQQKDLFDSEPEIIEEKQSLELSEVEESTDQIEPEQEETGVRMVEEKKEEPKADLKNEKTSALKAFWERLIRS